MKASIQRRAAWTGRTVVVAVCLAVAGISPAMAQRSPAVEPAANVVTTSATGQMEVPQDWLSMTLTATRDGADAAAVQTQLRQAVDAALTVIRPQALPQQLEVRTGSFGVFPRHGSNGRITGWQGSAELVVEGRDFLRISSTAAKASTMGIAQVVFTLSREAQLKLESEVQALAIERFKARANEVARGFGFGGYTLRDIAVTSADQGERPVFARAMAASPKASMAADTPLPVEPGKSQVTVTVSGSIQLR
jgi:predicted secreted protein